MSSSAAAVREREDDNDDLERSSKRTKLEDATIDNAEEDLATVEKKHEHILPPSHALLGVPLPVATEQGAMNFLERDVGISEYVGHGLPKIEGIIKQRFTDFLVFEVDQDSKVIHLKSLDKPESKPESAPIVSTPAEQPPAEDVQMGEPAADEDKVVSEEPASKEKEEKPEEKPAEASSDEPWPESFTTRLSAFLSESAIAGVKEMYLQGPEPPRVSDSGWAGRVPKTTEDEANDSVPAPEPEPEQPEPTSSRGKRGGRGERGGRGGRGRGGGRGGGREDTRRVLSDPIASKATRTGLHQAIRELFSGKLDSETDAAAPDTDEGSRIVIKWSKSRGGRGGRGGGRGGRGERVPRGTYPPYIHFTLQKTNRDTQDALGHLSRSLHVSVKDLSVAGTKDKRGVTVQRVSLKRGSKTVEDVWKLANGLTGRRTIEDALKYRGERGLRISDFNYRKAGLELGMLKGNAFLITLRNVRVESEQTMNEALNVIKNKGFINYYGMQRFGTASVPTHAIGLALLQSDWQKAVSLILQPRHGEHPDVEAARNAWLVDRDLDKALELMPRRVVAERCLLESFKTQKGDTRNAMGALDTIPKNLRLMYVHAYQSYVWNAIVSERIRTYGADKPVPGDLVFDTPSVDAEANGNADEPSAEKEEEPAEEPTSSRGGKRARKPYVAPVVKTLTEEDVDKYSIFDVIMPLPGTDVAYPGGKLGARYREFLQMDGLDADNFVRKQRIYTLNGSYRKILHLPEEMSWSVLRYTDPDVPLAQADEDKLLGFDAPITVEDGKFMALQIQLTLGTAAYATMALREITKTETSSHFQTGLTAASEDQKFRGTGEAEAAEAAIEGDVVEAVAEE